jgi:hypothetical protein
VRVAAILAGGFLAGIGGAALSVDYTQTWAQDMTKGKGLVAVGLVIVARWNPFLVIPVALFFGASETAVLRLQAEGVAVSSYLLAAARACRRICPRYSGDRGGCDSRYATRRPGRALPTPTPKPMKSGTSSTSSPASSCSSRAISYCDRKGASAWSHHRRGDETHRIKRVCRLRQGEDRR